MRGLLWLLGLFALAAGLAPSIHFNPVLLKPNSDTGCQVILQGRALGNMEAEAYHDYKQVAMATVLDSHQRLRQQYARIIVEGAGSPAEINLRAGDIANMGFAEVVDCPVILIADIDRGGVFAQLVGTLALLSESERARVQGFVINKFRGELALLQSGLDWLEQETGKPVLGVIPYLQGLEIAAEDAIATCQTTQMSQIRIVVPVLPRISNHTDFDALRLHPQVDFHWVGPGQAIPPADLIVLPGSKSVQADLAWLRAQGWEAAILRHLRYGGRVVGICGGFQMLGQTLADPLGLEGPPGSSAGLGLLDMDTVLERDKQLCNVRGSLSVELDHGQAAVAGYEIHMGRSAGPALSRPALVVDDGAGARTDGALSADGRILGTYVHGLFDAPEALAALLAWAGLERVQAVDLAARREADIDRLADAVERHLDVDALFDGKLPALKINAQDFA